MVWNQALLLRLSLVLETARNPQKTQAERLYKKQQLNYIRLVLLNELFVLAFPKNLIASFGVSDFTCKSSSTSGVA
ncbi:hypothetical protein OUZ56_011826 [Daphnia magna]|uniref:Uncharacterized protein n=1 Tax=Daphnia magna TaxID=35525 RepID=A0ABQ9Z1C1_9CRUS|nr:hypothetical protein OUZ56_011826 [Daphnia magna]